MIFLYQTIRLQSQKAAIQAELERHAEVTEQLEYELTKARKQLEKEQKSSTEKAKENKANVEQLEGYFLNFLHPVLKCVSQIE